MENEKETKYDKAMVNRIARVTGHLRSIKNMVEDGRDCSEVLIQLAAVKAAINGAGKEVLKQYMEECMEEAAQTHDTKKLNKVIDIFIK